VPALSGETGNPKTASFHLNAACFYQKHMKHVKNITWSHLNHPSLWKQLTMCTRQDLGRQRSILQYQPWSLAFTKSVTVSVAVSKWELFFIKHGVTVNGHYCWDILLSQQMLDTIIASFVFQQDSVPVHLAYNIVQSPTAVVQDSELPYFLSYGPVTVHSLTPMTMRFRESYSSMSMSCK